MQSTKFPDDPKSEALYQSLELSFIAARQGSEWVLVSGKAALKLWRDERQSQLQVWEDLDDLIAFRVFVQPENLNTFVAALRNSIVLEWFVLEGAGIRLPCGYRWTPPRVAKVPGLDWEKMLATHKVTETERRRFRLFRLNNPFEPITRYLPLAVKLYGPKIDCLLRLEENCYWHSRFEVWGEGPSPLSLLSEHTLEEIEIDDRLGHFSGLCAELGLDARRSHLSSCFQISADLPGGIAGVFAENNTIIVLTYSFGCPSVVVEWLPDSKFEVLRHAEYASRRVRRQLQGRLELAEMAYTEVPLGATGARLILCFGDFEVEADSAKFEFHACKPALEGAEFVELELMREEPTSAAAAITEGAHQKEAPHVATAEIANQQGPPDLATREAPNRGYGNKRRKPDPWVLKRRKIVRDNPEMEDDELCHEFDKAGIPLISGSHWDPHRKDDFPWVSAYDDPGFDYHLRQLIFQTIAHDRERT
jgi:hypothetical protein